MVLQPGTQKREDVRLVNNAYWKIDAIEEELGKKAIRNYMPMQTGDVPATWADASVLQQLTGYKPETGFREGIAQFVHWYRDYYEV